MSLIGMETGLTGYLEALAALDGDYLVLISAQGDVYEGFTESDWLLMTEMLGMNGEAVEEWYYTGTGTLDGVCCGGKDACQRLCTGRPDKNDCVESAGP